ncbi:hypothetical protein [Candidatus Spongiihabitans sp.]|uniref:hypothetical protein n=1 Tax=Candidatus Spongiihabitans sp. TaxID=3101308 RepID=UPI003C7CB565
MADINSMGNAAKVVQKISDGSPTGYEGEARGKYLQFENHFGRIKRMNGYFWYLLILIAIGYGFWHAIGTPGRYTENRGVDCPPDSGLFECLSIYVDRFSNVPLLFLMALILAFVVAVGIYETMRRKGEKVSKDDYDNGKAWLKKVSEEPRSPTPLWLFVVLILFLLVEAAAITLIASSFVADFTRTTEIWVGIFVGVICASALGWLVHHAGAQLYSNQKRKKLNKTFGTTDEEINDAIGDTDKPSSYSFLIASIVAVSIIVVLAFMQRYNLNMTILEDQLTYPQESLFDDDVPPEIGAIQKDNQQESAAHAGAREQQGLIAALSVPSMIFILVNGFGCGIGYKHSFICDKSEHAYKNIHKFEKWKSSEKEFEKNKADDNKKLYDKANNFHRAYFGRLTKEAERAKRGQDIPGALSKRGPYVIEQKEKT